MPTNHLRHHAILVTDRAGWEDRVSRICVALGATPSVVEWAAALGLSEPATILLPDLVPPLAERRRLLEKWSMMAWQPCCVVSLAPGRGGRELAETLKRLGYHWVVQNTGDEAYWEGLRNSIEKILEKRVWLAPRIARALGCYDSEVVRALSTALAILPEETTVESWSQALRMSRRQELAALFAERDLPPPKQMLEWVRMLNVVDFAAAAGEEPSRAKLADRFRYSSGDYLGKRAKDLTGASLGQLVEHGVEGLLELLSGRRGQENSE